MQTVTFQDTVIVSARIKPEKEKEVTNKAREQRISRSKFISKAILFYLKHLNEGVHNNEPS